MAADAPLPRGTVADAGYRPPDGGVLGPGVALAAGGSNVIVGHPYRGPLPLMYGFFGFTGTSWRCGGEYFGVP